MLNYTTMLGCHHCHKRKKIPKSVSNKNQACKDMQRSPILLTESDHDVILDKIKSINTIGYERKTSVEYRCETVN